MRITRKRTILLSIQLLCSAMFISVGGITVGIKGGQAAVASLSLPADRSQGTVTQESTDPSEPASEQTKPPKEPTEGTPIVQVDLSMSDGAEKLLFKNETDYKFDPDAILNSGYPIESVEGEAPSVLIIHTHATECYTEEGHATVTDTRSADPNKNMIAVGMVIADTLRQQGVTVIHDTTAHDDPSYSEAYIRSKETVKKHLGENPSIKYVIDVHRDAITTSTGEMAKPGLSHNGTPLAQMMLVVGTDEGGAEHPGWKTNLAVAIRAQTELQKVSEELMRPINIRSASFNQQLCEGFLLLEVGSCANTLGEATASAVIFAENFASMIKS